MTFAPSIYQQAIFDWIVNGSGHAIIEAVAGSGKTTTAVKAMNLIRNSKRVLFLAFNKSIAEELRDRVPGHCDALTLNSLGFRAWMRHAGKVRIEADKTVDVIREALTEAEQKRWLGTVKRLVGIAKSVGIAPAGVQGVKGLIEDTDEAWQDLIDHHDLELVDSEELIGLARRILSISCEQFHTIDFDDQLYLPVICGVSPPKYDWVFVDEAQDLSPVQQRLVEMAVAPGGRIVAIGDSRQAIYGFRGADSGSMRNFKERLQATSLELSICYRCPKSHVKLAQSIVPQIQAAPSAGEGEVQNFDQKWDASVFGNEDLVICRNSAPLVRAAYKILSQKMAVRILGRDLGVGIISLIRKMKAGSIGDLSLKIDAWHQREVDKLRNKDPEANTDKVDDRYETIMTFIDMFPQLSPEGICREIDRLYSNNTRGILTLCTIHKAKGLEAKRVFILNRFLMPAKGAKKPWQKEQESNLEYVAYSRSQSFLGFIDQPRKSSARNYGNDHQ